jgi:hypothetical protein
MVPAVKAVRGLAIVNHGKEYEQEDARAEREDGAFDSRALRWFKQRKVKMKNG